MSLRYQALGVVAALLGACGGGSSDATQHPTMGAGATSMGGAGATTSMGQGGSAGSAMTAGNAGSPSPMTGGSAGASAGSAGMTAAGGSSGSNTTCTSLAPISPRIWRLSARQYSNAVRDVLGLTAGPELVELGGENPLAFIADDALTVNYPMLNGMYGLLGPILDQVAPNIPTLAACTTGEASDACARRFATSFGAKAFRRALDTTEVDALMAPYTEGAKVDFSTGVRLMMESLLLSPSFLFRSELGTAQAPGILSPEEIASQLSFLLLNSVPDAELLAAAEDGTLTTPTGVASEVDRLLALPAVEDNITRIVADWFNVRGISEHAKATSYFDGLTPPAGTDIVTAVEADLGASMQAFISDVLWSGDQNLDGFLTSTKIFVNPRLATLYSLMYPGTGTEFMAVNAPADQRAGILTQPGIIWTNSGSQTTSVVHRGLFVNGDVACGDPIPDPPASLKGSIDAVAMLPTEMEKVNARAMNPQCAGCHAGFDPYGVVLQGLDPIGRHQTETEGAPVVDSAAFGLTPALTGTLEGPVALAQGLLTDKLFVRCGLKKMLGYAVGRALQGSSLCEIEALLTTLEQGGNTMPALLRAVALSSYTTTRTAGGAP